MLPTLTGAGAASLPPERFSTGIAVITMGRQIGSALGVALLVAILDDQTAIAPDFARRVVADDRRRGDRRAHAARRSAARSRARRPPRPSCRPR